MARITLLLASALVTVVFITTPSHAQEVVSDIRPPDNGESWEKNCPWEDHLTESQMAVQVKHIEMGSFPMGNHVNLNGTAVIELVVAKDGSVTCAKAVSGHPLALSGLIGRVQKWRFNPFVRDGVARRICGSLRIKFVVVNNRPSATVVRSSKG
jgi:hypothetical protein